MSGTEPPSESDGLGVEAIADSPPAQVDPAAAASESGERDTLQNDLLKSELEDRGQDRTERLKYAKHVFRLIIVWLVAVGVAVFLQAFHAWGFGLSDPVMLGLLGSTTASVIGIFLIVANYLFPRGPRQKP